MVVHVDCVCLFVCWWQCGVVRNCSASLVSACECGICGVNCIVWE